VNGLYNGYPDLGPELSTDTVEVNLVARDAAGVPLGCGALVPVDDGVFEVRRMWVRTEARGSGVGGEILTTLLEYAEASEAPAVVVETGEQQLRTIGFYEKHGFSRIAPFGPYTANPLSVCLAKAL
jgi:putative acetyltransferase